MEGQWDKAGNEINEKLFRLLYPSLEASLKEAITDVIKKARYFVNFNDLTRYIILSLEQRTRLPLKVKEKLTHELEEIYKKTQAEAVAFPLRQALGAPDTRAIEYTERLHDFYLGKFFQGDREIRLRAVKWFSEYYLKEGNPIGKGQDGIKDFLKQFGEYIGPQTEWKARQIKDTSINYLRNSARLRAIEKAKIKLYHWDAVGDRLTCAICKSYDGREFEVAEAVRVIETIENSDDPRAMADYKPFVREPYKGPSRNAPSKIPPLHPHCRCRIVASLEEEILPVTVERPAFARDTVAQRELEDEYRALTPKEIHNRILAHQGSDWLRPVKGEKGVKSYKKAKRDLEDHFAKHGLELGYKSLDEYSKGVYNIIREPEKVYVEITKGKVWYHFIKEGKVVVSSDDTLQIKSFYPFSEQRWRSIKRDGLIQIL